MSTQARFVSDALFEHRFWLQVFGDHARFFLNSLSSQEIDEAERAERLRAAFDQLLERARRELNEAETIALSREAAASVEELREFKLHLLKRQLVGKIGLNMSPTLLNHMLNELDEYARILPALCAGELPPRFGPVHHHIIWLSDACCHAETLDVSLDQVEKPLVQQSRLFAEHFRDFYLKAVEMAGFLRTRIAVFPALARLNKEAELEMRLFQTFLEELEELRLTKEALGNLMPLMADHMYREECYYLTKLAEVASGVNEPDCDPGKPRIE